MLVSSPEELSKRRNVLSDVAPPMFVTLADDRDLDSRRQSAIVCSLRSGVRSSGQGNRRPDGRHRRAPYLPGPVVRTAEHRQLHCRDRRRMRRRSMHRWLRSPTCRRSGRRP